MFQSVNDDEFLLSLENRISKYKIVLKTYNDVFFIKKWVEHYAQIFGYESLIIVDNCSTSDELLKYYQNLRQDVLICSFEGNHNLIHEESIYKSFFNSLKKSCEYYLFSDTDEFLIYFDGFEWSCGEKVKNELDSFFEKNNDIKGLPIIMASDYPLTDDFFRIDSNYILDSGLTWGKPFINSKYKSNHSGIHNSQIFSDFYTNKDLVGARLLILHMDNFSYEQRVKVNIAKLAKRNYCSENIDVNDLFGMDWQSWSDATARRFVHELKVFPKKTSDNIFDTNRDFCKLLKNGKVSYCENIDPLIISKIFSCQVNLNKIKDLILEGSPSYYIQKGLDARASKDYILSNSFFEEGLILFPDFKDGHGHAFFKKEIVRNLLIACDFEQAYQLLCHMKLDVSEHAILFARAYVAIGNIELARVWWILYSYTNPSHPELISFFDKNPPKPFGI